MKKILLYFSLFFSIQHTVFSQENNYIPPHHPNQNPVAPKDFTTFKERLYFGGNVGAWFGTTTYVNLSPLVGCKITKQFSVGGGITYNYYSQTYGRQKYTSTIYGVNVFARCCDVGAINAFFISRGADKTIVSPQLVYRLGNLAVGIGRKHFYHGVGYDSAVAIKHLPEQRYGGIARCKLRAIALIPFQPVMPKRTDSLGRWGVINLVHRAYSLNIEHG